MRAAASKVPGKRLKTPSTAVNEASSHEWHVIHQQAHHRRSGDRPSKWHVNPRCRDAKLSQDSFQTSFAQAQARREKRGPCIVDMCGELQKTHKLLRSAPTARNAGASSWPQTAAIRMPDEAGLHERVRACAHQATLSQGDVCTRRGVSYSSDRSCPVQRCCRERRRCCG